MQVNRLVVAGTHSGAGKTTIAIGLMAALARRGLRVQPYKIGPDYIDTSYHTLVTGRISRNLDSWMLSPSVLQSLFIRNAACADIAVIEGVMGLYDGTGVGQDGSTAAVAEILQAPVILVVDAAGMSTSAAAQVLGYQKFNPELALRGVILNNVFRGRHFELVKKAIEQTTGIPVLGCLPPAPDISLPSRHLGLVPAAEMEGMRARIRRLSHLVETSIDLEQVLVIAASAVSLPEHHSHPIPRPLPTPVKLAIARDSAFSFYYQDNLDLLEELGAELKFFSPLEDAKVPTDIDGIYLGGGFPEIFAKELSENSSMLLDINTRLKEGLPCFAECGGLMYLTSSIEDLEGRVYPMVDFLGGCAKMTKNLQRFGYVEIRFTTPNILGRPGDLARGHEFHHSVVEGVNLPQAYAVTPALSENSWKCGYLLNNVLAGYPHIHFWNNPGLAANFLMSCLKYRTKTKAFCYEMEPLMDVDER